MPKLCLVLLSNGLLASEQSQSTACFCHILSSELYLLPTYWEDADNQLHSLHSQHSSDSAPTYDPCACSDFFFLIFLNLCLARHGLLEAYLSSIAQCVSFTVPRWCNSWKIKNLLRPKFGVSHSMFTHFGSPLNEA